MYDISYKMSKVCSEVTVHMHNFISTYYSRKTIPGTREDHKEVHALHTPNVHTYLRQQLVNMTFQESGESGNHGEDCPLHQVPHRELVVTLQGAQESRAYFSGSALEENADGTVRDDL